MATISPGETVAQYIDYLTGENACRLFRQAACGTLCPKTAERSSSKTCRSSPSSSPIIGHTHYHHVLHYVYHLHCCQGGITEYTITISAIVGNAKMKGVTTKVWSMRLIFIMIFMSSFYLIICQQLSLGVSTSLSTTKVWVGFESDIHYDLHLEFLLDNLPTTIFRRIYPPFHHKI